MIDHVWSVLCQRATIDKDSNLISLLNSIEQLEVQAEIVELTASGPVPVVGERASIPISVVPIEAEVVSLWARRDVHQSAHGLGRLMWEDPAGKQTALGNGFDIDLTQFERLRTRVRLNGLPVSGWGRYYMVVEYRESEGDVAWRAAARLPLTIVLKS